MRTRPPRSRDAVDVAILRLTNTGQVVLPALVVPVSRPIGQRFRDDPAFGLVLLMNVDQVLEVVLVV